MEQKRRFICNLCGVDAAEVDNLWPSMQMRMQQHMVDAHGISADEIRGSREVRFRGGSVFQSAEAEHYGMPLFTFWEGLPSTGKYVCGRCGKEFHRLPGGEMPLMQVLKHLNEEHGVPDCKCPNKVSFHGGSLELDQEGHILYLFLEMP